MQLQNLVSFFVGAMRMDFGVYQTVWPVKSHPNVYKSCPKMILLEKLKILTPLQK